MSQTITRRLADRAGDDVLIVTADGTGRTARDCRDEVARRAAALAALGVRPGDRVATLQALHPEALLTWWAIDRLGARFLPLNPLWTPRLAGRVVGDRGPVLLVADDALRGLADAAARGTTVVGTAELDRASDEIPPHMPHGDLDDCAIVHNSGLPGIHHGVRTSARMLQVMSSNMVSTQRSRVLVAAPTCFTGVLLTVYGAIASGGSVALLPGLTAETFWPAVRRAGVTSASMLNPTVADLLALPPSPRDRDHPLRLVGAPPGAPELNAQAVERFGIAWNSGLGKTEVCGAVVSDRNPAPGRGVGRVRAPFVGRVVDPGGATVDVDEPGELVLRSEVPGGLPPGYADDDAASAHLWRGGWMHTGWHVRRDAEGYVHTVGDASIHPIVVKRAGYMFAADLEAEIVGLGTGVAAARVETRPGADDPVVTVHVTGHVDMDVLRTELAAGLPAHLVPDELVPTSGTSVA
jgi:crotonobetaine/carnitine-CoA ligase